MALSQNNQLLCFGFGQLIMLLNVVTGILSKYLSNEQASLPTLQSAFLYVSLAVVYLSIKFFYYRGRAATKTGVPLWFYVILGIVDVEGNYFAVKAFDYANYVTVGLLLNMTVPFATAMCYVFLKTRYQWQHYVGAVIAVCGSIVIFATDYDASINGDMSRELRGDFYCLIAALFYATSNVMIQSVVKVRDMHANVELLGCMGFVGAVVSLVQILLLEVDPIKKTDLNDRVYGYMTGYVATLFTFYTVVSVFLRLAESLFFNISLLTGPVFTVMASYLLFDESVKPLYWVALVIYYIGLTLYALTPAPLENLKAPEPSTAFHQLETPTLAKLEGEENSDRV